jgi:hypothetical protein
MAIENKSKPTFFRATPSERKLIERQAAKLNLRLSAYIRQCVLNDIAQRQSKEIAA